MYNNGGYGATYMYIQSSYSNSGTVSRHSYAYHAILSRLHATHC